MSVIEKRKSTSIRLKESLYKQIKFRAEQEQRSVNNYLERIISEAIEYYEPNEETKKALDQAIEDRLSSDRKWYNNVDEMFKDLMND